MSLADLLTPKDPLGPFDQAIVTDNGDAAHLLELVAPFMNSLERRASIILGRKGSGKSSILSGYRGTQFLDQQNALILENLPSSGDFIVPILAPEQFHEMVVSVARLFGPGLEYPTNADLIFPERISAFWEEVIWEEVLEHFKKMLNSKSANQETASVIRKYLSAQATDGEDLAAEIEEFFAEAKASVLGFLKKNSKKCYVLFDSMDKYPVNNNIFVNVAEGLLRCVGAFQARNPGIEVIFCFPEEMENAFVSSNTVKAFRSSYRLRWKPIDLLRIVAHRFRLFYQLHDREAFSWCQALSFDERRGLQAFFQQIMPPEVNNELGVSEDPLAYILRHTQLLPRHMVMIMNNIVTLSHQKTGSYQELDDRAIVEGVREAEELVARQILDHFNVRYPELDRQLRRVLPNVPPICSFSELDNVLKRIKGVEDLGEFEIWQLLYEAGVIGRVVEPGEATGIREHARYVYGRFHFVEAGLVGAANDARFCFHPVFSRYYGLFRRPESERRVVYPARVATISLTDLGE